MKYKDWFKANMQFAYQIYLPIRFIVT